jgi:S1-C subfamily serine protease
MRRFTKILLLCLVAALVAGALAAARPAQAVEKTVQQRILRASVKLMTPFDADKNGGSLCSGTMLNQEGYILTNYHCVGYVTSGSRDSSLEKLGLRPGDLYNRKGLTLIGITDNPRQLPVTTYVGQVLSGDSDLDLAVVKIVAYANSKQTLPKSLPVVTAPLADADKVETLDEVIVVGYPGIGGDTVTATEGKVSGFIDEDGDKVVDWFKTDVLINQGNSGGSAMNEAGELIGVPTIRLQDKTGNVLYLIRPVNHAIPLIERAMKAGGSSADLGRSAPAASGSTPSVPAGKNFGAMTFGTGFANNAVTGEATTFRSGVTEVHAAVPYQAMRDGAAWGYNWQLNGQDVTGQRDLAWKFGASGVLDLYLRGKNGLSDGAYNLQVLLGSSVISEGQFIVGSAKPKNTPQKPPATKSAGVTITGTIMDASTRRPVSGAIIVFLKPDMTVDDFDADTSAGKADTVASYGIANASGIFTTETPLARSQVYSVIVGAKGYARIAEDEALEIEASDPDLVELDPIELDRK